MAADVLAMGSFGLPLRAFLIDRAGLAERHADRVLSELERQMVDTVQDLLEFSELPEFDGLPRLAIKKVRCALDEAAMGLAPPLHPLLLRSALPASEPVRLPSSNSPSASALPNGVVRVGEELVCSLRRAGGSLCAPNAAAGGETPRLVATEHCKVST